VDDPSRQHTPADTIRAAATAYQEALKVDPNNPELHEDLARLLAELGQAEEAQKELERALEISPGFAAAHNHLGIHYLLKGEKSRAEQEFKAAIATEPRFAEAKNNLGCLYARRRETPKLWSYSVRLWPTGQTTWKRSSTGLFACRSRRLC
jgi:Flp pilus assembly protein TadD